MPLKIQMAVLDLIIRVTGGMIESRMPDWLIRPGRIECGKRWLLVCHIYLGRNASLKAISGAAQWPVNISKTLRTRIADLEDNLRKQEAYIAQAKLLEFMASRRNRLSPIRFANATAGLPFYRLAPL